MNHENNLNSQLKEAVKTENLILTEALLQQGADSNAQVSTYDKDITPMHLAVEYGHLNMMELLYRYGASINTEKPAFTPLMNSVTRDYPKAMLWLLAHGANIHAKDVNEKTALYYAKEYKKLYCAQLLLEAGAEPIEIIPVNRWESSYLWDKMNCKIFPMWMERVLFLRRGSMSGWRKIYGPPPWDQKNIEEVNPVNAMKERNFRQIRELAANKKLPIEESIMGKDTPLQYAIKGREYELVRLLLSLGAQVLLGYRKGESPIELAGQLEEEAIIQLLLEALTTDMALEQGMIPLEFGFGEWDYMWEGPEFCLYNGDPWIQNAEKLYIKNEEKSDAIKIHLHIGIGASEESRDNFFEALRRKVEPFGYQVWKTYWGCDFDLHEVEITRYTLFKAEEKWLAYEHMFFYDDCMELHLNTLKEWDHKYGIRFEELDYECMILSFEETPVDREKFWEEAIRIFPEEDDLDSADVNRRRRVFIKTGILELLLL